MGGPHKIDHKAHGNKYYSSLMFVFYKALYKILPMYMQNNKG